MDRLVSPLLYVTSLLFFGASAVVSFSQTPSSSPRPEFEVVSVKPTPSGSGRTLLQAIQGELVMTNISLRRLVLIAYGIQDYQLLGDPTWTGSEHYDIQAKADSNPSVQQLEGPMLQVLLENRFQLAIHHETRQLPVYQLTVGKGGPKLQTSKDGSCTPYSVNSPPLSTPSGPPITFCGLRLTVDGSNRTLDGKGITMAALAANLSRTYNSTLGRNIVDMTGLSEAFDIHLTWAIEPQIDPGSIGNASPPDLNVASIFTALPEQLGLKLESAKAPVDVVVIDHIERPSPN